MLQASLRSSPPDCSLCVNGGTPALGRDAIAALAQDFMTGFPDLHVTMHDLSIGDKAAIYCWTLTGTNTGPGGARRKVRIGGFERWRLGMDDRIAESQGHFDHADYQRQLHGIFSATTSQD